MNLRLNALHPNKIDTRHTLTSIVDGYVTDHLFPDEKKRTDLSLRDPLVVFDSRVPLTSLIAPRGYLHPVVLFMYDRGV